MRPSLIFEFKKEVLFYYNLLFHYFYLYTYIPLPSIIWYDLLIFIWFLIPPKLYYKLQEDSPRMLEVLYKHTVLNVKLNGFWSQLP